MDERLALRLLRRIMQWTEEVATQEYAWVRLIARLKYDGYGDYVAGVRFAESLAGWLVQFEPSDRQVAYNFIKDRLVYFSSAEVNRLVIQLQPRFVEPILRRAAGEICSVPPYLVFADQSAKAEFARRSRQTLYIGLSDGARIDILRRANTGKLVNDQTVLAMRFSLLRACAHYHLLKQHPSRSWLWFKDFPRLTTTTPRLPEVAESHHFKPE